MPELVLHFVTDGDVDTTANELQEFLASLPQTAEVSVEKEQPRLGVAEILAILSVAAKAGEIVTQIAAFVHSHRKHFKGVEIEIEGRRVPIDKLTDNEKALLRVVLDG